MAAEAMTGSRSPNVVQYGPDTRQNGGAGQTKDQHETTRSTTPLNLQNLHPRFKSGRRLQIFLRKLETHPQAGTAIGAHCAQIVPDFAAARLRRGKPIAV